MIPEQQQLIAALNRCTLTPASWDKRFARSLQRLSPETPLSAKQAEQLERMRQRYRRQLQRIAPALVADLAEPAAASTDHELERLRSG